MKRIVNFALIGSGGGALIAGYGWLESYSRYDWWEDAMPPIFIGSLIGAAVAAFLNNRSDRKN